jgi:hypothetical protein
MNGKILLKYRRIDPTPLNERKDFKRIEDGRFDSALFISTPLNERKDFTKV